MNSKMNSTLITTSALGSCPHTSGRQNAKGVVVRKRQPSRWRAALYFSRFLILMFGISISQSLRADEAGEQLSALMSNAESMTANFKQRIVDDNGDVLQESEGTVSVSRPFKLRWETVKPFNYLMVTDGDTLWRYDADLEQLNSEPLTEEMRQTPALLLGLGGAELQQNFDVVSADEGVFTLLPKGESPFTEMTVSFSEQGVIEAMTMSDSLGQRTTLELEDVSINPEMAAGIFTMDSNAIMQDSW